MKSILIFLLFIFLNVCVHAQTSWTKHPTPVLTRSATFPNWRGLATADPDVIMDNDTLKMWYSGSGWTASTDDCPHVRMGYAWSTDGINWNEYAGNPVLDVSADTSKFDSDGIETPTVIIDISAPLNQRYKLWYAGRKAKCQPINDHKFGFAYSSDGINWTKYIANPVLVPGNEAEWFNTFISSPSVILENEIYKMWFTAPDLILNDQPTDGKGNIGYATSTDGINWTINPDPVLIAGDQNNWDSASIAEPSVVKIGSTYHMFYSALDQWAIENFQVGYATSMNGIQWVKSTQNPVLQIGALGEWDRYWATHPTVVYDSLNSKFKMWYTGRDTATIVSLLGYYWDIGYAESNFSTSNLDFTSTGISFILYPNPAAESLTIYFAEAQKSNVQLQIYNSIGVLMNGIEIKNNSEIDIGDFENGLYFIKSVNFPFVSRKFMKQK